MSTTRRLLLSFVLLCTVIEVIGQSCAESGQWCNDDKGCCGGCCRSNTCIDMYESCMIFDDPCLDHYCPPGLVCYVFRPDCMGCSPMPDCKEPGSKF